MSNNSSSSSSGIGFAGLLTIAFIVLKLCNVIDWSWWWVLSPSFISLGIVIIIVSAFTIFAIYEIVKKESKRNDTGYTSDYPSESRFMRKLNERIRESEAKKSEN